jgi:hypothetical protein
MSEVKTKIEKPNPNFPPVKPSTLATTVASKWFNESKGRTYVAEKIIKIAAANGGQAFGGYPLHKVVHTLEEACNDKVVHTVKEACEDKVAEYSNFVLKSTWKDLDLWFKSKKQANQFLASILKNEEYVVKAGSNTCDIHSKKLTKFVNATRPGFEYPFDRMDIVVLHRLTWIKIMVDIVVLPVFPCNDFDCNQLAWDGKVISVYNEHGNLLSVNKALDRLEKIQRGECTMLSMYPLFSRHFSKKNLVSERVQRLINKGFTVTCPPEFLPKIKPLSKNKGEPLTSSTLSKPTKLEKEKENENTIESLEPLPYIKPFQSLPTLQTVVDSSTTKLTPMVAPNNCLDWLKTEPIGFKPQH